MTPDPQLVVDAVRILRDIIMGYESTGSTQSDQEDRAEADAALDRLVARIEHLEEASYRCHKMCGVGVAWCVDGADHVWAQERIEQLEKTLRDIAEERCPPDMEGDSERIRFWQQDLALGALESVST